MIDDFMIGFSVFVNLATSLFSQLTPRKLDVDFDQIVAMEDHSVSKDSNDDNTVKDSKDKGNLYP